MKRVVGTPTIKAKRPARSDTPDTVIMESDDLEIGKHDSQTFTPPMSPLSRKRNFLKSVLRQDDYFMTMSMMMTISLEMER